MRLSARNNRQHNNKHKDKRNQDQKPRDSRVTILADEVQNPSPEEDIDEFNDKKEEEVWNAHVHSSQLKGVHVTGEVLESNNDEANNRN